jgi:hypothetical protein
VQCPECGAPVSENDLFCGECGAVLSDLQAEPAAEPAVELPVQAPVARVSSSPPLYQAPPGPPPYAPAARDSRANTAYILGIVSVALAVLSCVPFVSVVSCVEPLVGLAAIVLGAVVKRDVDAKGGLEEDRKKANQGMILGIVGTVLWIALFVISFALGLGLGLMEEF